MSNGAIRPSTLDGIKRLAKSLKAERGVQHARALDDAAREAGFQNFRHACNALRSGAKPERPRSGHRVFITVPWKDRDAGGDGRETLIIWLSAPWGDLVTVPQLKYDRALSRFQPEAPDHLAQHILARSQSQARREICAAARTLQFMDATKLRPSTGYSRALPGDRSRDVLPGRDHESVWYDRRTKRYLIADEPYERGAEGKAAERTAWAKRQGFEIVKPAWPGMYNPDGGSRLYLIAHAEKGIPLEPIAAALDLLPPPIVEETWSGESAPIVPIFISPGKIARIDVTKAASKKSHKPSSKRNSIGYVQIFAGPQRRPKAKMPIDAHVEVGGLLKSVLSAAYYRKGVYNRINSMRSELDEWTQREYNEAELPSQKFFDIYYHESGTTFSRGISAAERDRHVDSLEGAKQILVKHYPDCPPLRSLLKKADAAIHSMRSWSS